MRVVRKLTRVMKTQWNYNKPIAKLIRSPGRRPFNNKTRSYGSRSRSYPRSRLTYTHTFVFIRMLKVYIHVSCVYRPEFSLPGHRRVLMCACMCMRIYVSARELISREPLCSLTDQTTGFLRFVHTCRTFLHGGSVCGHVTRTHPHLEERPRTAYRCENTFDHAVQPLRRYTYLPTFLPAGGRLLQPAKFQNTLMASVHQGNRITQWSNT